MSYYRSYFSKNNTILSTGDEGLLTNTAKNPNTEIYYGSGKSRYIFHVDLDDLKSKIDNGDYVLDENTEHTLHITNTIFGDEIFLGANNGKGRDRATSFDLILFKIDEYWDEGVGFDYEYTYDATLGNKTYDERPSNWVYRTTLDEWSQPGTYVITPDTTLATIHFDNGDENISVSTTGLTEYINSIITGETTNYGLGLAFEPGYIDIDSVVDQSVAFFTKYTQTFYEPFLETTFDDIIEDDRQTFYAEQTNTLYLYVTKGTNFYDLDNLPTVDILDSSNTEITGLTGLTTTKVRKGIYKVDFGISGEICYNERFFYDKWKDLMIDGVVIDDVTQKFVPADYTKGITIGDNPTELDRYSIQFFGVRMNEQIKRGSVRKIIVNFRSINGLGAILFDEVYYRVYVREGKTQVNVFDWTKLDKTNENSFLLDTNYLIPREYYIEIKAKTHTEEIFYKESMKFEIVSER